jgi:hypothetical protein
MRRLLALLPLVLPLAVCAQDAPSDSVPIGLSTTHPVVYASADSGLPERLAVTGVIEAASPTANCGVLCGGGTIAVRLDRPAPGGPERVFIVVPCLVSSDALVGRRVAFTAFRLTGAEDACYYRDVANRIDSQGAPFYAIGEHDWPAFR